MFDLIYLNGKSLCCFVINISKSTRLTISLSSEAFEINRKSKEEKGFKGQNIYRIDAHRSEESTKKKSDL